MHNTCLYIRETALLWINVLLLILHHDKQQTSSMTLALFIFTRAFSLANSRNLYFVPAKSYMSKLSVQKNYIEYKSGKGSVRTKWKKCQSRSFVTRKPKPTFFPASPLSPPPKQKETRLSRVLTADILFLKIRLLDK